MGKLVKQHWPLALIITCTFLTRVWNLEKLFYFTYDESIPAFVGRRLILWQHIPLIGGVTPFNFHLGPYFYWFYSAVLFLGNLNPISWGYASASIATITTFLIFKVGETFGNKKIAITAAILWSFSYLANIYDRHLWALYWGPITSLIVIISLYKIIKGNRKFIYLLATTVALSIHADPSNLVFLALSGLVWLIYRLPFPRNALIALGLIFISFLPLVVFDLRHNFANSRPVIDFINQGRNKPGFEPQKFIDNVLIFPRTATRLIYTLGDNQIPKQYSYCKAFVQEKYQAIPWYFVSAVSLILISFIIYNLSKNKKSSGWRIISVLIILYFFAIQLYGTIFRADIFEHYITGLSAVFLLIFAKIISLLPKKLWLTALAIFVIVNLQKLAMAQNSQGLTNKKMAIEFTMQQIGDRLFSLDSLSTCWKYSGYRYLFAAFGREPIKSYVDPNFGYLYGTTQIANKHPSTVVAFVIHDYFPETDQFYMRYNDLKSHEVKNALFGSIEVIVLDNTSGWFDQPETVKNPNIKAGQD